MKEKLTAFKTETHNWAIVGDFNNSLFIIHQIDRRSMKKIEHKKTIKESDLKDIYKILHPTNAEYTLFPSTHSMFCRTECILGHKTNLSKFNRSQIMQSIFSNHNIMKF